jgi:hypothetical protein
MEQMHSITSILKTLNKDWAVTQGTECLPSKWETLNSIPSATHTHTRLTFVMPATQDRRTADQGQPQQRKKKSYQDLIISKTSQAWYCMCATILVTIGGGGRKTAV